MCSRFCKFIVPIRFDIVTNITITYRKYLLEYINRNNGRSDKSHYCVYYHNDMMTKIFMHFSVYIEIST